MDTSTKFSDYRKWGSSSFLDFLEVNNIQFTYDGTWLTFDNKYSEERAKSIWFNLTGQKTIGVVS